MVTNRTFYSIIIKRLFLLIFTVSFAVTAQANSSFSPISINKQNRDTALTLIKQHLNQSIAGIYLLENPKTLVVRIKGNLTPTKYAHLKRHLAPLGSHANKRCQNTHLRNIHQQTKPPQLAIQFNAGALETVEEGEKRSSANLQTLIDLQTPHLQTAGFDQQTGAVIIEIYSKNPEQSQLDFDKINPFKNNKLPTHIIFSTVRLE